MHTQVSSGMGAGFRYSGAYAGLTAFVSESGLSSLQIQVQISFKNAGLLVYDLPNSKIAAARKIMSKPFLGYDIFIWG